MSSEITLTQLDINPMVVREGHPHWFPDLAIGSRAVDGHMVNGVIPEEYTWVKRALYLFKYGCDDPHVMTGSQKRVVVDLDENKAYSLEFYRSSRVGRREKIIRKTQKLDVIAPSCVFSLPVSGGEFVFQMMPRCEKMDLYYHAGALIADEDVKSVMDDVIFHITLQIRNLHKKRVYHQDIKVENIFQRCANSRWTLGDFEGV